MRETRSCPLCGRAITADHGLSDFNFESHVEACPRQERRRREREQRALERERRRQQREIEKASKGYRRRQEKAIASARKTGGVGSTVAPAPGQLGFPFEGVMEEVIA